MVSTGQMIGMGAAIVLPLLAAAVLYFIIHKHSKKMETGMIGAASYGCLGFLWQQLFYLMAIVALNMIPWFRNVGAENYIFQVVILSLLCGVFVALGLYWGVYLTNQKQRSLFRSTTIGIGFGVGNALWNIIAPYSMSLYQSFRINAGTFQDSEQTKKSIMATSVSTMCLDSLKCVLFLVIYMGIAHLMSRYYLEGKKLYAWGVPIVTQLLISLTNALMREYTPDIVSQIGIYVLLALLSVVSVWTVAQWLQRSQTS